MKNRHGRVVNARLPLADGHARRVAAPHVIKCRLHLNQSSQII
jgi:hypothetical protein